MIIDKERLIKIMRVSKRLVSQLVYAIAVFYCDEYHSNRKVTVCKPTVGLEQSREASHYRQYNNIRKIA